MRSLVQGIVDQEGWWMRTVSNKHELAQSIERPLSRELPSQPGLSLNNLLSA